MNMIFIFEDVVDIFPQKDEGHPTNFSAVPPGTPTTDRIGITIKE